jgi:hypothetical protein
MKLRPQRVSQHWALMAMLELGNTKGGSIIVPLTSCLTGLESVVWQLTIFVFICKTDLSKPVKQVVNRTVTPLVFLAWTFLIDFSLHHLPLRGPRRSWAGCHSHRETRRLPDSSRILNMVKVVKFVWNIYVPSQWHLFYEDRTACTRMKHLYIQWSSVTHQMAVPVPSISCCVS